MDHKALRTALIERHENSFEIILRTYDRYLAIVENDDNIQEQLPAEEIARAENIVDIFNAKSSNEINNLLFHELLPEFAILDFLFPVRVLQESGDDWRSTRYQYDYSRLDGVIPYFDKEAEAAGLDLDGLSLADWRPMVRASHDLYPILTFDELQDLYKMGDFGNVTTQALIAYYRDKGFPHGIGGPNLFDAFDAFDRGELDLHTEQDSAPPQEYKQPLQQRIIPPEYYPMMDHKIANTIFAGRALHSKKDDTVGVMLQGNSKNNTSQDPTIIYVILRYEAMEAAGSISVDVQLTPFDRSVLNAIVSLYKAKNASITIEAIWRAMSNRRSGEDMTQARRDEIMSSIEKMRSIKVYADVSAEAQRWHWKDENGNDLEEWIADGPLLILGGHTRKTKKGERRRDYTFLGCSPSPLLEYAEHNNQIITVPAECLSIKGMTDKGKLNSAPESNTPQRQVIKEYLLRRIANNRLSSTILFDDVFEKTGLAELSTRQKLRHKDYMMTCFQYWKATDFIKNYSPIKKGKSIAGVTVEKQK